MRDQWGDPWLQAPTTEPRSQHINSLLHKRCPCCGVQGSLLRGPRGGCSINILCDSCGTRFNVALFFDYFLADVEVITPGPRTVPAMERKFFRGLF